MKKFILLCFLILGFSGVTLANEPQTIHIMVALCDNQYQGIVKVPETIGNGQDPRNNLYWGALYGIRTHFNKSKDWKMVKSEKIDETILERVIFKHATKNWYIIADAYNGKYIKKTTEDFLTSSSGLEKDYIQLDDKKLGIKGNAKLISYIGHNGLMDFDLEGQYNNQDGVSRDVIILACYSKSYFSRKLDNSKVNPLLWTTNLMAPEAYTIHDAIEAYINKESQDKVREKGAQAYSKYQKCGLKAAKNLLVTGW
ncbi:hypothetical protein [Fusobacterium sp. PH5-44]|uniref:hypothetical protein n=1 Tax=unclassified Fusobacterium TaxID=2648384 RepID=UPI003D229ADE